MSMQDPIADMFVMIKNAQAVYKQSVVMPSSKLKVKIATLLEEEGYIAGFQVEKKDKKSLLIVTLKYYLGRPVIDLFNRVSRPSLRVYRSAKNLPTVRDGLGVAIISTSLGLMSDRKARAIGQGGEVIGMVA